MHRRLRHLVWISFAAGVAACGSKAQPPATPAAPAASCASMATHVGGNVAEGGDGRVVVEKVMRESCEADGWSAEGIDCLSRSTADLMALVPEQPREQQLAGCGATLTDAQLEGVGRRFAAEVDARMSSD